MFDSKNLHHAYIIEGDRVIIIEELKNFLEKELKFTTQGNPDFYLAEYDKLGVDEAREVVERQQQKAMSGERKIFALAASSITREAQNSLLKIFEEPTPGTHFFLIVPSAERLLPTLKSRAVILKAENSRAALEKGGAATKFLKANPAKRLEIVKEMLADLEKEKIVKADFLSFLNEIEKLKSYDISKETKKNERLGVEELLKMRNYLQDQSSSAKLILEYLALTL
jgi:DNA polymerase III delta prime subunit